MTCQAGGGLGVAYSNICHLHSACLDTSFLPETVPSHIVIIWYPATDASLGVLRPTYNAPCLLKCIPLLADACCCQMPSVYIPCLLPAPAPSEFCKEREQEVKLGTGSSSSLGTPKAFKLPA